jgi:type 1 fimbria pilin
VRQDPDSVAQRRLGQRRVHVEWFRDGDVRRKLCALLLILIAERCFADYLTCPKNVPVTPDLTFTSTSVGRNVPIGTAIQTAGQNLGLAANVTCNIQKVVVVDGISVAGDAMTFQTNVPGIGVRFYITAGWSGAWARVPEVETLPSTATSTQFFTRADLVVTGTVGSGVLTDLPKMTATFSGDCISAVSVIQSLTAGSTITATACSVTTPSIEVVLPKAFVSALSSVGSTTGQSPTSIGLDCNAGVKVNVTLSDASNISNRSTTLGLAPGSSASGVGVQILNGTTPVAYGPDSATAGTVSQWYAGTATGGAMEIPLTVRYVRTSGPLVPGAVRATATFTMSYQ